MDGYHSDRMSETSDKNGYHFPYTAEEDHLHSKLAGLRYGGDSHNVNTLPGSRLSSRHGSRTSSPPNSNGIQPMAPLTSIVDTSE